MPEKGDIVVRTNNENRKDGKHFTLDDAISKMNNNITDNYEVY